MHLAHITYLQKKNRRRSTKRIRLIIRVMKQTRVDCVQDRTSKPTEKHEYPMCIWYQLNTCSRFALHTAVVHESQPPPLPFPTDGATTVVVESPCASPPPQAAAATGWSKKSHNLLILIKTHRHSCSRFHIPALALVYFVSRGFLRL